jgi:hypothetical protein
VEPTSREIDVAVIEQKAAKDAKRRDLCDLRDLLLRTPGSALLRVLQGSAEEK